VQCIGCKDQARGPANLRRLSGLGRTKGQCEDDVRKGEGST